MPASPNEYDVLLRGSALTSLANDVRENLKCRRKHRVRILTNWSRVSDKPSRHLFVCSSIDGMRQADERNEAMRAKPGGTTRYLLFRGASTPDASAETIVDLSIRTPERFYIAEHNGAELRRFLLRFTSALAHSEDFQPVADARWSNRVLTVVSPEFDRLEVPLEKLLSIRKASETDWRTFEIDDYGRYVYWPTLDIHMGWSQLLQVVDPGAKLRAEQRSMQFNRAYGGAIRVLREEAGLTQSAIKHLDARTVRRIEKGETRATSRALKLLALAHGMPQDDYMQAIAERLQNCQP